MGRLRVTRRNMLLGATTGLAALSTLRWRLGDLNAQEASSTAFQAAFAQKRRNAFKALPPDDNRTLDILVPKGTAFEPWKVRSGQTVAFETGGVWEPAPEFKGLKGVRFTAYGDRDKPWPLFRGSRRSFKLIRCWNCTVEFLEASDFAADCWHVFDSQDIVFQWVIGHDSGRIRGNNPDSGNRGHAFELRGSKLTAVTFRGCEGYAMAEDGLQTGPDVKRGIITVDDCYFHDNIEDGIDIKAGDFSITSTRLDNNMSKAVVMHGNAGRLIARDCRFAGSKLHDGVYIDGKNGKLKKLQKPLVFERCEFVDNTGWGLIAKRTRADIILKDTFFAKNGAGDWESGTDHRGEIRVL